MKVYLYYTMQELKVSITNMFLKIQKVFIKGLIMFHKHICIIIKITTLVIIIMFSMQLHVHIHQDLT